MQSYLIWLVAINVYISIYIYISKHYINYSYICMVLFAELLMMLSLQTIVRNTAPLHARLSVSMCILHLKSYFNYLLFSNLIEHEVAINTTYIHN
jgi:hypothetical protein